MNLHAKAQDCIDLLKPRGYTEAEILNASLYCFIRQPQKDQDEYVKIIKALMGTEPIIKTTVSLEEKGAAPATTPDKKKGRPPKSDQPAKEEKKEESSEDTLNVDDIFKNLEK